MREHTNDVTFRTMDNSFATEPDFKPGPSFVKTGLQSMQSKVFGDENESDSPNMSSCSSDENCDMGADEGGIGNKMPDQNKGKGILHVHKQGDKHLEHPKAKV